MTLKRFSFIVYLICLRLFAIAQTPDSLTYYLDYEYEPCDSSEAFYYRKCIWKDKLLRVVDYYISTRTPQRICYFKDKGAQLSTDTVITFYKTGEVKSCGRYLNDTAVGLWIDYFDSGQKDSEGNYQSGKKNGKWVYYHKNGITSSLEIYQDDSLQKMRCWDENGVPLSVCYETQIPEFSGGIKSMNEFITKSVKYPESCRQNGIEGRVLTTFIVDTNGVLSNFEIVYSAHPEFSKESLRVLKQMPKWTYYPNHNRMTKYSFSLPFVFSLQ